MDAPELRAQVLATWRRHNDILLYLLDEVPPGGGWTALPAGSRGRDVARQFAHLDRVRRAWVGYHETGKPARPPRVDKGPPPTKAKLRKALKDSGAQVGAFLERAMTDDVKPRLFGGDVIRWMGYLISHESHHRGQIMLAMKQSGVRVPQKVSMDGLWGRWIYK